LFALAEGGDVIDFPSSISRAVEREPIHSSLNKSHFGAQSERSKFESTQLDFK
jgi:hypothetical protein